jgi:polyvinyl alcohol dehydrogenase (cytochrome)
MAIVTQSPTIYDGVVYDGVASTEENGVDCGAAINACYFRGSESAVDLATGEINWKTYTISDQQSAAGYSGAAVWGSSPAIDVNRQSVYVTTGNNYGTPRSCSSALRRPVPTSGRGPTASRRTTATTSMRSSRSI